MLWLPFQNVIFIFSALAVFFHHALFGAQYRFPVGRGARVRAVFAFRCDFDFGLLFHFGYPCLFRRCLYCSILFAYFQPPKGTGLRKATAPPRRVRKPTPPRGREQPFPQRCSLRREKFLKAENHTALTAPHSKAVRR